MMIRPRPASSMSSNGARLPRSLLLVPLALSALLSSPLRAQTDDEAHRAAERARAAALEAEGKALRDQAEATFEATVPGCHEKFLVNRCIDQARKQRLETIQRARTLEAEARGITLRERQRAAAQADTGGNARSLAPATPSELPTTAPAAAPAPVPDAGIAPSPEAERIRAQRDAAADAAKAEAARKRAETEDQRASERRSAEEAAARRAQQAAEDRARYDERIRRYEEEQAAKKK